MLFNEENWNFSLLPELTELKQNWLQFWCIHISMSEQQWLHPSFSGWGGYWGSAWVSWGLLLHSGWLLCCQTPHLMYWWWASAVTAASVVRDNQFRPFGLAHFSDWQDYPSATSRPPHAAQHSVTAGSAGGTTFCYTVYERFSLMNVPFLWHHCHFFKM